MRLGHPQNGRYVFETIAPSPIATLATWGQVSLMVLLPWEDEDIRVQVLECSEGVAVEQGQVKECKWVAWHWQNDPVSGWSTATSSGAAGRAEETAAECVCHPISLLIRRGPPQHANTPHSSGISSTLTKSSSAWSASSKGM